MLEMLRFKNQEKRISGDGGPTFQDRNGTGLQTGVEVIGHCGGIVALVPVSSHGTANCHMEIPVSEMHGFIEKLQAVMSRMKASPHHNKIA